MFKKLLFFLYATIAIGQNLRSNFDVQKFTGHWLQTSSNYYIQNVQEIDWQCITVDVKQVRPYVVTVSKNPLIHGTDLKNGQSFIRYGVAENLLKSGKDHLLVKGVGPIVNGKYDYVILTKNDNITQFVWARDYYRYLTYQDTIETQLKKWDYTSKYKKPMSSYDESCLHH